MMAWLKRALGVLVEPAHPQTPAPVEEVTKAVEDSRKSYIQACETLIHVSEESKQKSDATIALMKGR